MSRSPNDLTLENAALTRWCVHVLGPDDVYPAPTFLDAVDRAAEMNAHTFGYMAKRDEPNDILCFAYAAPWPHGEKSHAAGRENWNG